MKWLKIEDRLGLDGPEPVQDAPVEPELVMEEEVIVSEEIEDTERKGVFKGLSRALRNLVGGDKLVEEQVSAYVAALDEDRMVIVTDHDFQITNINEFGKSALGLTNESIGKSIIGMVFPDKEESRIMLDNVKYALLTEQEMFHTVIVKAQCPGSRIGWINFSAEAVKDDQGTIVGIRWGGRDITDSVMAPVEAGQPRHHSFISVIESIPSPIMVVGTGGMIITWNSKFLGLWGLDAKKEEVTPESLLSVILLNVKDHQTFVDKVIESSPEEQIGSIPVELRDGRKFTCQNRTADIVDLKDCTVWAFQPLFSQGRCMGAKEERPEVHMEDIPDLLIEVDAKSKMLFASRGLEGVLGHRLDDMVGYDIFNFIHPEDLSRLKDVIAKTDQETNRAEVRFIRADGGLVWMQLDCKRLPLLNGSPTGHLIVGMEISDRKMAERSMIDLIHVFRSLMRHTHDGVWLMDESGIVIQWNEAMERLTSIAPDESIGRALPDLEPLCRGFSVIFEKVVSKLHQKDMLILNNELQTVFTTRSGVSNAVIIEVHRIVTDKGHLVLGMCVQECHSASKAASIGDLYQRIVENSPDPIFSTDSQGLITYCNRSVEGILGKKWDDIVGKRVKELLPSWTFQERGLLDPACPAPFEMEIRDPQGRYRVYKITTLKVLDDKSEIQYHGEDVTERALMRKRLLASEDLSKKLLDSHMDPSFITDVSGGVDLANERSCTLLDIDRCRESWTNAVADFDRENANDLISNVISKGRCQDRTIHLKGKDGSQYVASLDIEPVLGMDGTHSGFLFIFRNVAQNGKAAPDLMIGSVGQAFASTDNDGPSGGDSIPLTQCSADTLVKAQSSAAMPAPASKDKKEQLAADYAMIGKASPCWHSLHDMCISAAKEMGDDVDSLGEIDKEEIFADPLILKVIGKLVENSLIHGGDISKIDIKFFVGERGAYIVVEDDGKGIAKQNKETMFEYALDGRNGHDLNFVREVLGVTNLEITEVGEQGKGARFEIFVPHDRHRRQKA